MKRSYSLRRLLRESFEEETADRARIVRLWLRIWEDLKKWQNTK